MFITIRNIHKKSIFGVSISPSVSACSHPPPPPTLGDVQVIQYFSRDGKKWYVIFWLMVGGKCFFLVFMCIFSSSCFSFSELVSVPRLLFRSVFKVVYLKKCQWTLVSGVWNDCVWMYFKAGLAGGGGRREGNTAHCTVNNTQCTLHTAHNAHCSLHTAHSTLHTEHCTLLSSHFTLHTSHC